MRRVIQRMHSRRKLKDTERALCIDYGDWLLEQRTVELTNASNLTVLLQAARVFERAHGDERAREVRELYDYISAEFGVMPPPVGELPEGRDRPGFVDKRALLAMCEGLMRESEIIPDWMFHGRKMPRELLSKEEAEAAAGVASTPKVGSLFDDP